MDEDRVLFGIAYCGNFYLVCLSMILRFDTLKKALLDIVKDGVVLNDRQILRFSFELLVRVLAGTAHGIHWHLLRSHLLGHLAGS